MCFGLNRPDLLKRPQRGQQGRRYCNLRLYLCYLCTDLNYVKMEQSIYRFVNVVTFMVVSGVLQLVGLVTPGWIVINTSSFKSHMGLFYKISCVRDSCHTKTNVEYRRMFGTDEGFVPLHEFRVETIFGLIFCIFTVVILQHINHMKWKIQTDGYWKGLRFTLGTAAFSATLSLVAAAKFTIVNVYLKHYELGISTFGFPYSVFCSGFGGVLAGIYVLAVIAKLLLKPADGSLPLNALQINESSASVYYPRTQPSVVPYQPNQGRTSTDPD